MKTKFLVITFIIFTLSSCKNDNKNTLKTNNLNTEIINNTENGKYCYQYIIENNYKSKGEIISEKDYININFTLNNNKVEGVYILTSNNGDILKGTFNGTLKNNIITSIHTYKRNSESLKDELILKIENNKLSILGGEKELINGVNMFINKDKGIYILDLNKINCN